MVFNWQGTEFTLVQGGLGVLTEDIAGHVHSQNSYEIHYIVSGKGRLITDKREYDLSEGVFFVTGPDAYHEQKTDKDDPLTEVHCYLQVHSKKTKDVLVNAFFEKHFYLKKHKSFKKYFSRLAEELGDRQVGYESMVKGCLNCVLTEYARGLIGDHGQAELKMPSDLNDKRYLQIEVEFMDNGENVTLSALSEKIGLSERQTQRLLREYYGMNFREIKKSILSKRHGCP